MTRAPSATRTRDLPLRRRLLYPLSYQGLRVPSLPGSRPARPADARRPGRASSAVGVTQLIAFLAGQHAAILASH